MTPSEDLFRLIKSLSPNEKGYFKKFSRLHVREGKNNYMVLFEAIEKQEEYDEASLLKKFKREQFVNQFPVAKNYLFNLILKALDVYHSEIDLEIGFLIHCSLMLTDKAMFDAANKYLKKAKVLAKQYHKLSYLNKIHNHELYLLRMDFPVKHSDHADELYKERAENAEQMRYVIELQHINDQMMILLTESFGVKRTSAIAQMDKLMTAPEMKLNPEVLNIQALGEYWTARINYYLAKNDNKNLYQSTTAMMQVLVDKKELANRRVKLIALQNHCKACLLMLKINEAQTTVKQLKDFESLNELDSFSVFQSVTTTELQINLFTGDFEKSVQLIAKAEKELEKFNAIIQTGFRAEIAQLAALTYFANGHYKEATKWINDVLNAKQSEISEPIVSACKMLELIICMEHNKVDLFEYKFRSYERQCKKEKEVKSFDLLMINALRKIAIADKKDLTAKYNAALTIYKSEIEKDNTKAYHFGNFNLELWLSSKQKNVPFSVLLSIH